MSPETAPSPDRPRRGGLFTRIFLTFLTTAIASAVVAAVAGFSFAARLSSEWIEQATETIDQRIPELQAALGDAPTLEQSTRALGQELDAQVGVFDRKGQRLAGEGPPRLPRGALRDRRQPLRQGKPVVLRRGRFEPPGVAYALLSPDDGRVAAVVAVMPRPGFRLTVPLLVLGLMIPVLGLGAWTLSRSLTRRLARIEASADRIARGELRHRIELESEVPRDELDQLGRAFNEMAEKVEGLIQGQRVLLANVSHELRTPIARMKVLVEILQERVDALRASGDESRPVQRLHKGLADLGVDIGEVESLISDLLTSGRLELRHGAAAAVQAHAIDLPALLQRVAGRVGATVELEGEPTLFADELLVERLLSNLLANARRACPTGTLQVAARRDGDRTELTVVDEGPGVDPADRESIFEPFTRLDHARDRDRGGVGLGLYLCRQICLAHGGSIEVGDRLDGARGARFEVRLPAASA
ncbi:MAG: HAMP domain-containing protein [Myxococcales bacterium]|nr:HAMP domain-containing protein [Myxococcales bacterium]